MKYIKKAANFSNLKVHLPLLHLQQLPSTFFFASIVFSSSFTTNSTHATNNRDKESEREKERQGERQAQLTEGRWEVT